MNNEFYYVFYTHDGFNIYERTCGDILSAEARVKDLKKIYDDATYFKNEIPKDYNWLY